MKSRINAVSMVAWAMLAAGVLGGCAGESFAPVNNDTEFQNVVIRNNQPVLVYFYKGG